MMQASLFNAQEADVNDQSASAMLPKTSGLLSPAEQAGYLMALTQLSGLGARTILKLLNAAGDNPKTVWEAPESFLKIHLTRKELAAFHEGREKYKNLDTNALWERYHALNIDVLTILDPDYPSLLKEIYDPPVVLYIRGDRRTLTFPSLGVVGNRRISDYGRQVTQKLIKELSDTGAAQLPLSIVSGLAEGVDGEAHRAALQWGLPTVAVFGCGIDIVFPTVHQKLAQAILDAGGALVSEYPIGFPGSKHTFPQRNRIVAGLSQAVLVIEGSDRSGSLITARLASEENRTVFAVPGNIFAPGAQGPLKLLRQGATPVSHGQQILEELHWLPEMPIQPVDGAIAEFGPIVDTSAMSEEELLVWEALPMDPSESVAMDDLADDLAKRLQWSSAKLTETVSLMELSGYLRSLPGSRLARAMS